MGLFTWLKDTFSAEGRARRTAQRCMTFAQIGLMKGDDAAAISYWNVAIDSRALPRYDEAIALLSRGAARERIGDTRGAILDLTRVAQMERLSGEVMAKALLNLGIIKVRTGDHQGGLQDLTSAIESGSVVPDLVSDDRHLARLWRGRARIGVGDLQGAKEDLASVASSTDLVDIPRLVEIKQAAEKELNEITG